MLSWVSVVRLVYGRLVWSSGLWSAVVVYDLVDLVIQVWQLISISIDWQAMAATFRKTWFYSSFKLIVYRCLLDSMWLLAKYLGKVEENWKFPKKFQFQLNEQLLNTSSFVINYWLLICIWLPVIDIFHCLTKYNWLLPNVRHFSVVGRYVRV